MKAKKRRKRDDGEMTQNVRKAGLVLEGGGMRGVFTAGVLDFFDDIHLCSTPTTPAFSHPSFLKEGNLVTTDF